MCWEAREEGGGEKGGCWSVKQFFIQVRSLFFFLFFLIFFFPLDSQTTSIYQRVKEIDYKRNIHSITRWGWSHHRLSKHARTARFSTAYSLDLTIKGPRKRCWSLPLPCNHTSLGAQHEKNLLRYGWRELAIATVLFPQVFLCWNPLLNVRG